MKAILVIDMPKACAECKLMSLYGIGESICNPVDWERRPSWCPLKPMPMKRETHVYWKSVGIGNIPTHEISDYDKGWNDCVDFLEGEDYE